MLVTLKHLIEEGYIKEDDRDGYSIYYIIPKQYVIRDCQDNTLFSVQVVKSEEEGEYDTICLIREDNNDPINNALDDIFVVTIFKQLEGLNGL